MLSQHPIAMALIGLLALLIKKSPDISKLLLKLLKLGESKKRPPNNLTLGTAVDVYSN